MSSCVGGDAANGHDYFHGLVAAAAVGQLSSRDAHALNQHLEVCEACRRDLVELDEVATLIRRPSAGVDNYRQLSIDCWFSEN